MLRIRDPLGAESHVQFHFCSVSQSLFELELAGCNEVTEAGLWSCLTPRIVSLSLADCINIADEAVGAVAQLLPSLYEFSLQVSAPDPPGAAATETFDVFIFDSRHPRRRTM